MGCLPTATSLYLLLFSPLLGTANRYHVGPWCRRPERRLDPPTRAPLEAVLASNTCM